jgi:hypothetical protein
MYMKRFQRKIEDFVCEKCGTAVAGTGYTNHCPKCLYSKHVDVNPGDRANSCGGIMKPTGLEMDHGEYIILHVCEKCGEKKKNKTAKNDDPEALIKLAKSLA